MLLCREQREIFSVVLTSPFCSLVQCCMFHSLAVGKDETDNLLQVFNIGRLQVAQKLYIQREFKHVVCQCSGGSAMCSSPNSAGLRWLNVLGRQGASGSVLSCQAWCECERRATQCQKLVVKYVGSFSPFPCAPGILLQGVIRSSFTPLISKGLTLGM